MTRLAFDLQPLGMSCHVYTIDDDGHKEELQGIQRLAVHAAYDASTQVYLQGLPLPDGATLEVDGELNQVPNPNWPPAYAPWLLRRLHLERDSDVSGVSGTGVVAMGVDLGIPGVPGGPNVLVLHWFGAFGTTVVHHQGLESVLAIHGHDGRTRVVYDD